jgi:hypothetical protein
MQREALQKDALSGKPGAEVRLREVISRAQEAMVQATADMQQYQQQLSKYREASIAAVRADSELSQRLLQEKQAALSIVEAQLGKIKGYETEFGNMDTNRQSAVTFAAKQAQQFGYGSLAPEQRALLNSTGATSEYARNMAQEIGKDNPFLQDLLKITGQQDRATLEAEQKKLQAQIELQFVADGEKMIRAMEEAIKSVEPKMQKVIQQMLMNSITGVEIQRTLTRIGNGS